MVGSLKGINWILPLFICFSITPNYGLSQSASEEGRCSHIDLRESSFRNMRVFEQNSDDCFVYASVQMVDGWRFSHGDHNYDHQTSPIATAITATIDHPVENPVDIALGGMSGMCEVVDSIKSHGSCDLRSVSDKYGPLDLPDSRRNPQTFENFLSKMQKLYREDHAAYDLATKRRDHGKLKEIVKD
ncbi:MAG: hypothetical protein ACXWOH_05490, partial [Bdellovibrionota bacterium]